MWKHAYHSVPDLWSVFPAWHIHRGCMCEHAGYMFETRRSRMILLCFSISSWGNILVEMEVSPLIPASWNWNGGNRVPIWEASLALIWLITVNQTVCALACVTRLQGKCSILTNLIWINCTDSVAFHYNAVTWALFLKLKMMDCRPDAFTTSPVSVCICVCMCVCACECV